MAQAKHGDTVRVHYTGRLEDGTVFDTTASRDPLEFTIGKGQIISGFEEAVIGMNPGESKTVNVPANKAYGPYRKEMVVEVERSQIPENLNPQVGQLLEIRQMDGRTIIV